jgi:SAM-dependent methyltransferase
MDEYVPAFIRNSYWFMYPFYFFAYRGKNIKKVMNFKSLVRSFTPDEYSKFYSELNSISRNRKTDLTEKQVRFILKNISIDTKSILDVGCGKGYLLERIKKEYPAIGLAGTDVVGQPTVSDIDFCPGNITALPFADEAFDTVICTHTIEHILDLPLAIKELERVSQKQLIIVTPCQRYFYYTLDEHINFFPEKEMLTSLFSSQYFICEKIDFDWVYIGYKT